MPDYAAMKVEYPKLKAALTRAKKKSPVAVLEEVVRAYQRFDVIGWPDGWHRWNMAGYDAIQEVQLGRYTLSTDEGDPYSEYDRFRVARDAYWSY